MKCSIALCTYNGERYLKDQLESLLQQTHRPDEIVVSDDGSTDKTVEIVHSVLRPSTIPYRVLTHTKKLGVFENFSVCMSSCTGDLIFPCDQDDVWKKDKIARHLAVHQANPTVSLVYSNATVVFNTIDNELYPLWDFNLIRNGQYHSRSNLVFKGRSIAGFCMSVRSDFFKSISPLPKDVYHDDWCATCAALQDSIYGIPESLAYYRQHGSNAVGIIRGGKLSYWKSLFTNVKFYVESDRTISERHHRVFAELSKRPNLLSSTTLEELNEVETLYRNRTYELKSYRQSNQLLLDNLMHGRYRYHHGVFTYLKDVYNLSIMKLFVHSK